MASLARSIALVTVGSLIALSNGQGAYTKLTAFPTVSVADGRSSISISAELRDGQGKLVPDGTQVFFNTTLGAFRDSVVATVNGTARATLIAGGIPGIATITASGVGVSAAPATYEYEFVADRSLLSSAREYVEIVSPGYMQYAVDEQIIGAAGPNRGVHVRYRDVEIDADDIQLTIPRYNLKARKARLKIGRWVKEFDELEFILNQRRGIGTTTFMTRRFDAIAGWVRGIGFYRTEDDGKLTIPPLEERFGVVEIRAGKITPSSKPVNSASFEFKDLSGSIATVSAKKAVVFPRKEIQFQRAEVIVGGAKVMKLPLFVASLNGTNREMFGQQWVNVNDNQIAVNYPYYLSLKPGQTSLLRFRTGGTTDRSGKAAGGVYLDYELNWNKGDEMQGGLTFSGIARDDWVASVRQYAQFTPTTSANFQIDVPAAQSLFGSASVNSQFPGFQTTLSASLTRTLRGLPSNRDDMSFVIEKDPTKVGKLPVRIYYGATASSSRASSDDYSYSQQTAGLRLRGQVLPQRLDKKTNLNASFSLSKLVGDTTNDGIAFFASTALTRQLTPNASAVLTYDYTRDGFNDAISGRHRVSLQGYWDQGNLSLRFLGGTSLDVDRRNLYVDLSYRFARDWRFSYGYTFDTYEGNTFLDYNLLLGYRIGGREVGLSWSYLSNRIGFTLLGATF